MVEAPIPSGGAVGVGVGSWIGSRRLPCAGRRLLCRKRCLLSNKRRLLDSFWRLLCNGRRMSGHKGVLAI
jgi:hypothetical protein